MVETINKLIRVSRQLLQELGREPTPEAVSYTHLDVYKRQEQLIKQFPSDVVEILDQSGKPYYGCPTCKRAVTVELINVRDADRCLPGIISARKTQKRGR